MNFNRGNAILLVDLVVDVLAIVVVLYLFATGYFSDLSRSQLNSIFLKIGLVGLALAAITIYLLVKRD